MRADTRPYFIAAIIQTSIPSAAPRFGMLRYLFQLLAPPSDQTIYGRRKRARVVNYWYQGRLPPPNSPPLAPASQEPALVARIRPRKKAA
jgi:hypothetical protein